VATDMEESGKSDITIHRAVVRIRLRILIGVSRKVLRYDGTDGKA
jgi:hypothetical protein